MSNIAVPLTCDVCHSVLRLDGFEPDEDFSSYESACTVARDAPVLRPVFVCPDDACVPAEPEFALATPDAPLQYMNMAFVQVRYPHRRLKVVAVNGLNSDSRPLECLALSRFIESKLHAVGFRTVGDLISEINAGRFHLYPNLGPVALDVVLQSLKESGYDVDVFAYEF